MKITKLAVLAAAVLAVAAPAHAIDNMTGVYNGKMSCKGNRDGVATKSKGDASVSVVDDTTVRLLVTLDSVLLGGTVNVFRLVDDAKPDRAKIQGLDCPSTTSSPTSLTIAGDVVIQTGSEKGTIKGTLIRRNSPDPASIDVCTFTVKRTSTELPEVVACPPI
jgi:hypothetical protein